ncbi:MAG: hypothetical protein QOE23_3908 [Pseudonocardiales bacterium]|jgi:hypothetical protein|nr:hypothetical protein [Pseudonocardiales bacterium]
MSDPNKPNPAGSGPVPPPPPPPPKQPDDNPPMNPNPYMGGGSTPP